MDNDDYEMEIYNRLIGEPMKNLNYEQINQIYSSTKKHVKMLAELAAWTGINRSEYLRRLIEVEHARLEAIRKESETQPTN